MLEECLKSAYAFVVLLDGGHERRNMRVDAVPGDGTAIGMLRDVDVGVAGSGQVVVDLVVRGHDKCWA